MIILKAEKYVSENIKLDDLYSQDIKEIFEKYFETKVITKEYRRFKSNNNETDADSVIEYIWVGKKI